MPVGTTTKPKKTSSAKNPDATEEPTNRHEASRASSTSSSSGSSSGSGSSSSSSNSSSSDSDSSSSSDNESDSSSSSSPNKNRATPQLQPTSTTTTNSNLNSNKDLTKGVRRSSRSCSSSRASSAVSSRASSVSSTKSKSSQKSQKKPATLITSTSTSQKKPSSTTKSVNGSKHGVKVTSNSNSSAAGASKKATKKKSQSAAAVSNAKHEPGTSKGKNKIQNKSPTKKHNSKKGEEDRKLATSTSGVNSTGTKSKVVKSGTVTNTRTIKPLVPSTSSPIKRKIPSGKVLPQKINEDTNSPVKTNKKLPAGGAGTSRAKKRPATAPNPKPDSSNKKESPNEKDKGIVSTTTGSLSLKAGRTRSQSSCSSATASTTSSAASSSADEDDRGDSSLPSSPTKRIVGTKTKNKKAILQKTIKAKVPGSHVNGTGSGSGAIALAGRKKIVRVAEKVIKKKAVARNLASELLSSADEDSEAKADGTVAGVKKKQPHQRRPVTRRQKSGVKKTIPTTTAFNQSLLLAATNAASSPTTTPKKSQSSLTIAAAASSSATDHLQLSTLPSSSSIINRRSTSNSSANSSASETECRERSRKSAFPLSSLTQSSSKNKYLSTWDSDFSDDNFNQQLNHNAANFIRVPAKTSSRPRTFDFSQALLDPEAYEPPRCPFPSCDSSGHLSGKYPNHNFLSCCPRYHGFEVLECAENDQERSRREAERSRYRNILSTPGKKPPKQTTETKAWLGSMKDLKGTQTRDGLVSEYDSLLWKDSLAIAADRIEKEQNEGINNQGIYYRLSMAVAMGRFEMKCWCASPYPEPLSQNRRLFVCEFCLKPVGSGTVLRRHCAKCVWRHPPGDEIYRKDRLSVWEVDGKKQKTYCQNLCLLAKCFLDHKTLYLDVDPFLFYVMTLADSQGCHLVGYFSKEKNSFLNYNVSCILTLPPYMRQGFGRLLIDFSYLLTRVEGKVGSPEKPLSDLGLISYRSYWKDACLRRLCACASREINIKDLSIELGVSTADLISTLQYLGMLKYWKGKHLVLKKQDVLEEYLERVRRRGNEQRQIDSSCLRWRPYQAPPDEHSSSEKS